MRVRSTIGGCNEFGETTSFSEKESVVSDPEEINPETKNANSNANKISSSFIFMFVCLCYY